MEKIMRFLLILAFSLMFINNIITAPKKILKPQVKTINQNKETYLYQKYETESNKYNYTLYRKTERLISVNKLDNILQRIYVPVKNDEFNAVASDRNLIIIRSYAKYQNC